MFLWHSFANEKVDPHADVGHLLFSLKTVLHLYTVYCSSVPLDYICSFLQYLRSILFHIINTIKEPGAKTDF